MRPILVLKYYFFPAIHGVPLFSGPQIVKTVNNKSANDGRPLSCQLFPKKVLGKTSIRSNQFFFFNKINFRMKTSKEVIFTNITGAAIVTEMYFLKSYILSDRKEGV
jgi:hypothetical protein